MGKDGGAGVLEDTDFVAKDMAVDWVTECKKNISGPEQTHKLQAAP